MAGREDDSGQFHGNGMKVVDWGDEGAKVRWERVGSEKREGRKGSVARKICLGEV